MAIHPKLSILLLIAPLVTSFAFIYQYSPLLLNDNDVKCGNTIAFTEIISRQRHCKKGSAAAKHSCFIVSYATTSKHQHDGNHHEGRKRKRKKKNNHRHEETNNSNHQKPTSDTKKEDDDDDDDDCRYGCEYDCGSPNGGRDRKWNCGSRHDNRHDHHRQLHGCR
mmetsp:Transcript_1442/g.2329  ORF Transcript_1442/g.2329 Transcript_1442/m.2329 type:complete len:165 (+) Transcript_1442:77-571(+)